MAKMGRPTKYTPELATEICEKISSIGMSVKHLCEMYDHWPNECTIYEWRHVHKDFSKLYDEAKKRQVTALVDDILSISDDGRNDYTTNARGEDICDAEWIARSRLRVDTRKWIAARLAPRIYGDDAAVRELNEEMEELKKLLEAKNAKEKANG